MESLLETVNITREEQINKHYAAATAELKEKIADHPLKTTFHIYSGCISREITAEIAHRFNAGGVKTTANEYGILTSNYYLTVDISLPEALVHPEQVQKPEIVEEKVEVTIEVTTEQPKQE
jgi:hypothetical protein